MQALGASEKELQQQIAPDLDNLMPLGDLKALTADQGSPPLLAAQASAYGKAGQLQSTILSHRFPLASGLLPEVLSLTRQKIRSPGSGRANGRLLPNGT